MKRWLYGLRMGNNNSYCLLLWIITGVLFLLAIFVTIVGKPVFQPRQAQPQELTPADAFKQELQRWDAEWAGKKSEETEKIRSWLIPAIEKIRSWLPIILFSLASLVGLILLAQRKRIAGAAFLAIGALGLMIALLASWHYGALILWIIFIFSFLGSLIYTPIALRDEVEELVKEASEKIRMRDQIEARTSNPNNPTSPASGGTDTTTSAQQTSSKGWVAKLVDGLKNSWIARIISVDLTIEFLQTLVRRLFRSK